MRRAVASAPSAIVLLLAGCGSGPVLQSADLELTFQREGEGRAAVTALAFAGRGSLAIGSFRGELEELDLDRDASMPGPESARPGEVLALGRLGDEPIAIRRDGEPFQWGRLTGALATSDGRFVGWSRLARTLSAAGPRDVRLGGIDATAAAFAGDRLLVITGRSAEPSRLECRAWPSLEVQWAVALDGAAQGVAADPAAGVVVVTSATELDVRSLEDGALRAKVAAAPSLPFALVDGRRFLLVQDEWLAVLDLASGPEPEVRPGFLAHRGGVTAVAVSADASQLATGGARGDLRVFRILPPPRSEVRGAPP